MSKKSWEHLQPLRISSGWKIEYNKLEDLEPSNLSKQDNRWSFVFTEDILLLTQTYTRKRNKQLEEQTVFIDLGWYPDGDPDGSFRLVAILNEDWDHPLADFSSRSKAEIVETLETWLFQNTYLWIY